MAITNKDDLVNSLANASQVLLYDKVPLLNTAAGLQYSLWGIDGPPGPGVVPTSPAILTSQTHGAMRFVNAASGKNLHVTRLNAWVNQAGNDLQIHDRLAHMGGLSGTVTTPQTVNLDVSGASNNLVNRRGDANYSDVQWWIEWYEDTGSTAIVTITADYTNAQGVPKTAAVWSNLTGPVRRGRMVPMCLLASGLQEYVQSIQSITFSTNTGAAGNFGITATRAVASMSLGAAQSSATADWQQLGLPRVHDDTCLFPMVISGAASNLGRLAGHIVLSEG